MSSSDMASSKISGNKTAEQHMKAPLLKRITSNPGIFGGQPIIRNMRMQAEVLLDYLSSGWTEKELLQDFPGLELEDIEACRLWQQDQAQCKAS